MSTRAAGLAIVTDFDGTACVQDVGDTLCAHFAPEAFAAFERALVRGECSLREAQARLWPQLRLDPAALERWLEHAITLRPGLEALLDWAAQRGVAVWIASAGFRLYIDALLGRLGPRRAGLQVVANELRLDAHGRCTLRFADRARWGCARCSVCKARVLERLRARGVRTVFCGDGRSDRCAIGVADLLCVVRGSALEHLARERGVPHLPFEDYRELLPRLDSVSACASRA